MSKLETNTIDTISGTTNLTIGGANNTGTTTIKTNNTAAVTIDNSQKVGIGTTSPDSGLHITQDVNPVLKLDRGSANGTNLNLNYNGTLTGQISTGSNSFEVSAVGASTPTKFFANGSEAMRINSDGDVLIGTTSTLLSGSEKFSLNGLSTFERAGTVANFNRINSEGTCISFYQANGLRGTISVGGSSTAYNTSSDYRLKENVNYDFDATSRLKELKPARFNFIEEADKTVDGFLAHEVSNIVPEAITGTKDAVDEDGNPEYQGIDQSKLVPLLVKTIQELEARITELENK
jgi:hypothetical protein